MYQVSGIVTISFSMPVEADSQEAAETFVHEEGVPELWWESEDIDVWEVITDE